MEVPAAPAAVAAAATAAAAEAVDTPTEARPAEGGAVIEALASRPSSSTEAEANTPTTRAAVAAGPGAEAATSLLRDKTEK